MAKGTIQIRIAETREEVLKLILQLTPEERREALMTAAIIKRRAEGEKIDEVLESIIPTSWPNVKEKRG